jgi:hypothetical protein
MERQRTYHFIVSSFENRNDQKMEKTAARKDRMGPSKQSFAQITTPLVLTDYPALAAIVERSGVVLAENLFGRINFRPRV